MVTSLSYHKKDEESLVVGPIANVQVKPGKNYRQRKMRTLPVSFCLLKGGQKRGGEGKKSNCTFVKPSKERVRKGGNKGNGVRALVRQ